MKFFVLQKAYKDAETRIAEDHQSPMVASDAHLTS